ncbi:MAG: MBL fold metallo-hydrolase [Chloroflexi bacterium AL-W]|nr:MBL fold metallo-hydrolase [Chloroflexi bacterium AL-N1]NOK67739.1 MBL fold metallo-hydrolase [Chloroflexi bacterium AL-N10]NOK75491.1 MBL fold metallo-hydrolase [Chloroflexi bacterium AL-N5]NOK82279.1 MBL fold metallo-hydrolase [Chloroflexi bacterium AL-W]NOK90124.1 MBL fold metallo-hydrolase [Chloroflexi bacterium AL-N15]
MTTTDTQVTAPSLPVTDLYAKLLRNEPLFILDVRNAEDFKRWGVEGRSALEVVNLPYYDFIEDEEGSIARVPADRDILVICAKEGASQYVAELLQGQGIQAAYLEGGIASWGNFYDIRDVVNKPSGRIVQIARPARGDLSFMVISDGVAAIVDPLRHIEYYLTVAQEANVTIKEIFDTHIHADHISGGPALAQRLGVPYYVHAYDAIHPIDMLPAKIDYHHLVDGQTFTIGQFSLKVVWFPGHTLGQVNYLFTAPDGDSYLFTGDGIFLSSFGRPDLGGKGETWTPMLYQSMFERLPQHITDDTMILPAHFSHLDEGGDNGLFVEPFGTVRQQNDGLKPRTLEEFTSYVLGHLPVFPPEYVEIKRVNIGLTIPNEEQASELELGKNICALSNA